LFHQAIAAIHHVYAQQRCAQLSIGTEIMTEATTAQPVSADAQQVSANAQTTSRKSQIPRFNHRSMTCFETRQIQNIEILKNRSGGSDSSVVRAAVDVLSFLNNLPTSTDPSIYLNSWLANNLTNQNRGDR
jgi:hypothetical protein